MLLQSVRPLGTALVLSALVGGLVLTGSLVAQNRNNNNNNAQVAPAPTAQRTNELRSIDNKAVKVQDEFVKGAVELARDYEKAGDIERSIQLLEAVLKVQPDLDVVNKKIEELKEQILAANDYKIDVDADGAWGKPLGYVRKGKPFRIQVTGTYKLTTALTVGPQGFPTGDLQNEMLGGIPCGAMAGLVVPKDAPARNRDGEDAVSPFLVGDSTEVVPKDSGYVYLKVNVPPGSKCSGKFNVRLSGYILSPDLNNIGSKK